MCFLFFKSAELLYLKSYREILLGGGGGGGEGKSFNAPAGIQCKCILFREKGR